LVSSRRTDGFNPRRGSEKSSDEGWAHDATQALREWKFAPAQKDGTPLPVPCTIDFVRVN
jgi:hypothetical protein